MLGCLCFFLLPSCQFSSNCLSKDSFISGYDKFLEDVEKNHEKILVDQWERIDKEYTDYISNCYKKYREELSVKEKIGFWKNTLLYGVYRKSVDDTYDFDLKEQGLDLDEEINTLSQEGKEELRQFIRDEIAPQVDGVLESIIQEIESLGEQFKNWLDEM